MIKGALITDAMISQPIPDVGNASGMGSPFWNEGMVGRDVPFEMIVKKI